MSLERILKILENFGIAGIDSEIYIYLAKKGPKKAQDLASALKIGKQEIGLSLNSLQTKGVVTTTFEQSTLFSAVAFERVLDLLIKVNFERATVIKETKEELLASWRTNIKREDT